MAPSKCAMRARIIFASIGLFIGVSIFLCFGIGYNNWDTAVWGLLSVEKKYTEPYEGVRLAGFHLRELLRRRPEGIPKQFPRVEPKPVSPPNWGSKFVSPSKRGVFAGATLILHIWYWRNEGTQYKMLAHRMKPIMISGCFVQLAGVCGFVAYLTVAIFEHQELTPYGRGFYLTCVWCFMTWKWGFLLFLSARSYRNEFRSLYRYGGSHTKYEPIPGTDYTT